MGKAQHLERGTRGESLAARYLSQKGFRILERNWRYQHLEIDLIASDGDDLVIVEVKTRKEEDPSLPEELIPQKKQRYIIEAAEAYIRQNEIDRETRFDVIIIHTGTSGTSLEHIPGAFYPGL